MGVDITDCKVVEVGTHSATKDAITEKSAAAEFNWHSIRPEWTSWDMLPKSAEGEYAVVGGRKYSRHAIDNMMPSGFGRGPAMSDPWDRGFGVSPRIVEEAIRNGSPEHNSDGDSSKMNYRLGNVLVTVGNSDGRVISVGYRKSK
jgi:hypothetical protein